MEALTDSKIYSEEQIQHGMRRSLKGNAADKLRRLGPKATVTEILHHLDLDYGTVESQGSILRNFYSCQQKPDETVSAYTTRLEDLFEDAVKLEALHSNPEILKQAFHSGLTPKLKHMTLFQLKSGVPYPELKREVRKLEAEMKTEQSATKMTCKAAISSEEKETSELSEMKQLLQQINQRIEKLEKKEKRDQDFYRPTFNGRGRGRGAYGNGRGRGREDTQRRPIGAQQFQPRFNCFYCGEEGHYQRDCKKLMETLCYRCQGQGHIASNCPN